MYQGKALNKMIKIITDRNQLKDYEPDIVMTYMIKILFYYGEISKANMCEWKRRRKMRFVKNCYRSLLKLYVPAKTKQIVHAVINTINEDKLWKFETFCLEITNILLEHGVNGSVVVHTICDLIESNRINTNVYDNRAIIKILYEILDTYKWPEINDTVTAIERLLNLFYKTLQNTNAYDTLISCKKLKKSLEICLRNMIKHLPNDQLLIIIHHMCSWTMQKNMNDNIILEFGGILEYTAYMHQATLYEKTLTPTIFSLLMQMIASNSKIVSLLGNRVMQYLIDRNGNRLHFDTPKIFFENIDFGLKFSNCYNEDKIFFKVHREILHDSLLKSILNHRTSRMNLETSYCTICIIAIEVPCSFMAAALVCLTMNLQDLILQENNLHNIADHHIHAVVISIMSLLCWIHNAKVFYKYVNKIMMERAHCAPHLNPPIQSQYNFVVHHIFWYKPELFFIDWETRYGLWKCFRLQNYQNNNLKNND
ncbi:uncharacterized protein LOC122519835 [Polistes fuscatus]|uniref:uncharacterized protein LOC122519835 n=1 Tax=Polistes fuscatus TaxID=30207 RepID=UPI001CA876C5|nr:uncharacterized protein LOC122519835 [Polistes fuscatus]